MLDTTDPRSLLRAAIAGRDEAAEAELKAANALAASKRLLDDAEQTVSVLFAGLDAEIASHRANVIKAWAENGGDRPTDALPPLLASKKDFKAEMEARVANERIAYAQLSNEFITASDLRRNAERHVRCAAGVVMTAEAASLVADLWRAKQVVWSLSDKLLALGSVRIDPKTKIAMPEDAVIVLGIKDPSQKAVNMPSPFVIKCERWGRYLDELARDPEASLDSVG